MVHFPAGDRDAGHGGGGAGGKFHHVEAEAAIGSGRAGEHDLHGLVQSRGGAGWPGDGERAGAPGELAVKGQERQSPEVVAVEVGNEHGADLARVEAECLERAQ